MQSRHSALSVQLPPDTLKHYEPPSEIADGYLNMKKSMECPYITVSKI